MQPEEKEAVWLAMKKKEGGAYETVQSSYWLKFLFSDSVSR